MSIGCEMACNKLNGMTGRVEIDPYIGTIFVFDRPQRLTPGSNVLSTYIVLEYLPGEEPTEEDQCQS